MGKSPYFQGRFFLAGRETTLKNTLQKKSVRSPLLKHLAPRKKPGLNSKRRDAPAVPWALPTSPGTVRPGRVHGVHGQQAPATSRGVAEIMEGCPFMDGGFMGKSLGKDVKKTM